MIIALLLPKSVIYPSISFDIMDGIRQSFKTLGLQDEHQIISAGIGVGSKHEEIYERCEQFLLDGADIVIGYINPLAVEFVHPLFEASGKTLLVLDSGYHFPNFKGRLSSAYFISLQGCLSARVIVNKAFQDGYKKFAFTCSFYDAGYRPSYVYPAAVENHGGEIVFNHVTSLKRSDFTMTPLFNFIQEEKGTAVLAAFCGDMAEDFFNGSHNIIKNNHVYIAGYTADETWLSKIQYPENDVCVAVPWSRKLSSDKNQIFVQIMNNLKEGKSNLFSLLGWEAALFINKENVLFDDISIDSPRGRVWMNPENRFSEAPIYISKLTEDQNTGNCILSDLVEASETERERELLKNDISYIQSIEANTWFNAYACLES